MAKKQKEEIPADIEISERLHAAQEARRKAWEEKQAQKAEIEDSRDEFRKFFIKIKGKLGLSKDMEEVIWIHFKSAGFDKKDKFEEGIKHFGYKL